jgi:hypothetical protein
MVKKKLLDKLKAVESVKIAAQNIFFFGGGDGELNRTAK